MKLSLQPSRVQNWSLLGLKPMHRALVRRSVNQINSPFDGSSTPLIEWQVDGLSSTRDANATAMLQSIGVLIFDRGALLSRVALDDCSDPFVKALHKPNRNQIRLLWHWAWQGKSDLLWCTEETFDGVIHDASSMRAWLSICLKKGRTIESQRNGLLQGIELPRLGSHSSNAVGEV